VVQCTVDPAGSDRFLVAHFLVSGAQAWSMQFRVVIGYPERSVMFRRGPSGGPACCPELRSGGRCGPVWILLVLTSHWSPCS